MLRILLNLRLFINPSSNELVIQFTHSVDWGLPNSSYNVINIDYGFYVSLTHLIKSVFIQSISCAYKYNDTHKVSLNILI